MSSPLSPKRGGLLGKILIRFHQKSSHNNRIQLLTDHISTLILDNLPQAKSILDIGCGDMKLAELVQEKTRIQKLVCTDIYPKNHELDAKWEKYVSFDGKNLPFGDKEFDVILLVDVLHHAGMNIPTLLSEAKRCSRYIIIKDHFEYGIYSRTLLKAMDVVGNWGYGVEIPNNYFSKNSFHTLLQKSELIEQKRVFPIQLYDHLPIVKNILRPEWQFISLLKSNTLEP